MGRCVPDSVSLRPAPVTVRYEHGSECPATGQEIIHFLGGAQPHGVEEFATHVVCARAFHKNGCNLVTDVVTV